jgi:hypothetical protein
MDKKEKKVERSRGRARTVQERSKAWDELNRKMVAKKAREVALALEKENRLDSDDMDEDEEIAIDPTVVDGVKDLDVKDSPPTGGGTSDTTIGAIAEAQEEDDDIL